MLFCFVESFLSFVVVAVFCFFVLFCFVFGFLFCFCFFVFLFFLFCFVLLIPTCQKINFKVKVQNDHHLKYEGLSATLVLGRISTFGK